MISCNEVSLTGHLGADPKLDYIPSGSAVAKFSLAVSNDKYNRSTDSWDKDTIWVQVSCWKELAEKVSEKFKKGTYVLISGSLSQGEWEDKEGNKRNQPTVIARRVTADSREGLSSNGQ